MFRCYGFLVMAVVLSASATLGQLKERADKYKFLFDNIELKPDNALNYHLFKASSTVLDSSVYQDWISGEWHNKQSSLYSYSNNLKDEVILFRVFENNSWKPKVRTARKYDVDRNLIWESVELFTDNKWEFVQQKFATYVNGLLTEELFQSWNNNSWVNYTRFTSKYDVNGKVTELLSETWVADQWLNTTRYTTKYDGNYNDTLLLAETWNLGWINQYKYEKEFNNNNLVTVSNYYQWENDNWNQVNRTTYTYNDKNEILEILNEQWVNSILVNSNITLNTYDEAGTKKITEVYKRWNFTENDWENDVRYTYLYNNEKPTGQIGENWIDDTWVKTYKTAVDEQELQFTTSTFVWENEEWVNSARYINFYKNITSVKDQVRPASFSLEQNFPNPFNPSTTITCTLSETQHISLKIFNVLGQLVKTLVNGEVAAGTHSINFNASGLSGGVYYYRIESSSGLSETRTMMLLK